MFPSADGSWQVYRISVLTEGKASLPSGPALLANPTKTALQAGFGFRRGRGGRARD